MDLVTAGYEEPARLGAGREQAPVEANHPAVAQPHAAGGDIQLSDGHVGQKLDAMAAVPIGRLDHRQLVRRLAAQEFLGERRSVVGQRRLLPYEDDRSLESSAAQHPGAAG